VAYICGVRECFCGMVDI